MKIHFLGNGLIICLWYFWEQTQERVFSVARSFWSCSILDTREAYSIELSIRISERTQERASFSTCRVDPRHVRTLLTILYLHQKTFESQPWTLWLHHIVFRLFGRFSNGFLRNLDFLGRIFKEFRMILSEHINHCPMGLQHELIFGWSYRWLQNWIQLGTQLFKLPLSHRGFVIITFLIDDKGDESEILKSFLVITKDDV